MLRHKHLQLKQLFNSSRYTGNQRTPYLLFDLGWVFNRALCTLVVKPHPIFDQYCPIFDQYGVKKRKYGVQHPILIITPQFGDKFIKYGIK
jgi:hypothetical protein